MFRGIRKEFVSSYGLLIKCDYCNWAVPKAAVIDEQISLCEFCAEKADSSESRKFKFGNCSESIFKCPASLSGESCGAIDLTFREFILGACCEVAANGVQDVGICDRIKLTEKYLQMAKKTVEKVKELSVEADQVAEKAIKDFEGVKNTFSEIMTDTQDYIDANAALEEDICQGPMRTASDSIKSIIGMEMNVAEIAKTSAEGARKRLEFALRDLERIEKRRAFLLLEASLKTDKIDPAEHQKENYENASKIRVTRVRKLR